jgi:hypothetical protein
MHQAPGRVSPTAHAWLDTKIAADHCDDLLHPTAADLGGDLRDQGQVGKLRVDGGHGSARRATSAAGQARGQQASGLTRAGVADRCRPAPDTRPDVRRANAILATELRFQVRRAGEGAAEAIGQAILFRSVCHQCSISAFTLNATWKVAGNLRRVDAPISLPQPSSHNRGAAETWPTSTP